jgi:tetratricopeptide (TPR) repeat protein
MLENGTHATIAEIAATEKINESYVGRVLRLTLLAPDIVEAILDGHQPAEMTLAGLMRIPALNGLANVMLIEWGSTWYSGTSEEHLAAMERIVNRALAIKPDDALAIYFQGYVLKRLRENLDQALVAFERAIAIDPNLAVAHNYVGQIKVFLGRANEAVEHTLKAIQLSPRDPQLAEWYYQVALTYIHQQRYKEAIEWARRGVQVNPNLRYPYRVLAAALALSGRVDEARTVAAEMLRRYPKETISAFLTREPWTNPVYRAGQEREIEGMRLAGIPE